MRFRAFFLMLAFGLASPVLASDLVVGRTAPAITLHTLDGAEIGTESLRGKVVILNFWATWCVPCREEMPLLSDYASRHAGEGVVVLGFSLDNPNAMAQVRKISANFGFPVGLLGSAWAGGYGRMWRLPVSFVIDREGILRHDGWTDDQQPLTQESLEKIVTPLLK
jgi:thiol-disulfide isomerase/thioredoxin